MLCLPLWAKNDIIKKEKSGVKNKGLQNGNIGGGKKQMKYFERKIGVFLKKSAANDILSLRNKAFVKIDHTCQKDGGGKFL